MKQISDFLVGYIKKTDGFGGLYRGLAPRLISAVASNFVSNAVQSVSSYCVTMHDFPKYLLLFCKTSQSHEIGKLQCLLRRLENMRKMNMHLSLFSFISVELFIME